MMPKSYLLLASFLLALLILTPSSAEDFAVGVGREVITPTEPMRMAGYAARKEASDGKTHDLWAKALAIDDGGETPAVIVTLDILGISAPVAQATATMVREKLGIPRERLMLTSSHTHCGPVVRDNLIGMYGLHEDETRAVTAYTNALPGKILRAIEMAIQDLEAGSLTRGVGHADFAGNRRQYTPNGVINNINPIGPVDHDVPVLVARRADGSVKCVLFGYACHNTTLGFQQLSGDYAGFAQSRIEAKMPGVTALFAAGCGGDQNPLPRRTLTLAELYGEMLGDAVIDVLAAKPIPVDGPITAAYEEIPLALSPAPDRAEVEAQLTDSNVYIQRRAEHLLDVIDTEGALPETYPYPVQVWRFADAFQMTALGGEATVDYALRIKDEFGADRQFVIAYANDVCSYIPSLRVLREGGYEGDTSMIYYGFHGPWAPSIEEDIMAAVHRLADRRTLISLKNSEQLAERKPLLIAHRGGVVAPGKPECSRAAIIAASLAGYDLVELDILASKDGQPFVFHDKTLRPVCDAEGSIADYDASVIREFRFAENGDEILHLDEALALCVRERLGVLLDIKAEGDATFYRRILGLLERHSLVESTMCINGAKDVRTHLGEHIMLRVTDDTAEDLSGAFWFGLASELTAELSKDFQRRGALVIPGINTFRYDDATHREDARADAQRLLEAGVDGFQIDSIYQEDFGLASTN